MQSPTLGRALDRNGQLARLEPVMFGVDFREHGEFGIEPGGEVVNSSPLCHFPDSLTSMLSLVRHAW